MSVLKIKTDLIDKWVCELETLIHDRENSYQTKAYRSELITENDWEKHKISTIKMQMALADIQNGLDKLKAI